MEPVFVNKMAMGTNLLTLARNKPTLPNFKIVHSMILLRKQYIMKQINHLT